MEVQALRESNFLHLEDVYKSYGDNLVLDDIDFSLAQGEFCSVVGPSGCGKSTLLRVILGQESQDSGQVLLQGDPVGPPDIRRGVVYQKYSLFPHLSVIDNVLLGYKLGVKDSNTKEAIERASHYLETVKLGDSMHKYPHELSGGMQQRVAVIQTLFVNPKLVLMDEPFGALDPGTREDLQMFLLDLWHEHKMTVIFVTHDLEEALFVGTRLIVLSQYYKDERQGEDVKHGSQIVMDLDIKPPGTIYTTSSKQSEELQSLIAEIRQKGFEPDYLQNAKDFDLRHPHSFETP